MEPAAFETKPVVWLLNAVVLRKGKRKRRVSLGYCTAGKGVAFATSRNTLLFPLTFGCILLWREGEGRWCSDGEQCFNLKCRFNRANPAKMKGRGVRTREELERLHNLFESCAEKLKEMYGERIFQAELPTIIRFPRGPPLEATYP
ncbi:MAG: hypothetical protein QXT28_09260 [Thermofilaceae archaeon]